MGPWGLTLWCPAAKHTYITVGPLLFCMTPPPPSTLSCNFWLNHFLQHSSCCCVPRVCVYVCVHAPLRSGRRWRRWTGSLWRRRWKPGDAASRRTRCAAEARTCGGSSAWSDDTDKPFTTVHTTARIHSYLSTPTRTVSTPVHTCSGLFRPVWACLGLSGPFLSHLNLFTHVAPLFTWVHTRSYPCPLPCLHLSHLITPVASSSQPHLYAWVWLRFMPVTTHSSPHWFLLFTPVHTCRLLYTPVCACSYLSEPVHTRLYLFILVYICNYTCARPHITVHTWLYLSVPG